MENTFEIIKGKVTLITHTQKGDYPIRELKNRVLKSIGASETRHVHYFENVDLLIKDVSQINRLIKLVKELKSEFIYILLIGYKPKIHKSINSIIDKIIEV
ncbi:MAG: hypothetical protein ACRC0G_07225 [Fusobacteriaceae bacterium]